MNTSLICVDAGLVIRLVAVPESTAVQQLWDTWTQKGQQIIAPSLLFYEVTNALYRYQKNGLLSERAVDLALRAAQSLPVELHADGDLHANALRIARLYGLSAAYDAHYLALAQAFGAEMWTADQRLANACKLEWVKLVT